MIAFTLEKIMDKPGLLKASVRQPIYKDSTAFLAGQLYIIRYAGQPKVCCILSRKNNIITCGIGIFSVDEFNLLAVCYLGYRLSFLGLFWLPWVMVDPMTLVNDLSKGIYNSEEFWKVKRSELGQC